MIKLDEDSAASILNEAHAVFDLTTVCVDVLTPCMAEIGEAWHRHEISVATEHFATSYVRGRLMTLLQSFPVRRGAPRLVVGCAPNERHDVGGLMVSVMLRRDGFRVDFLGADVPIEDVVIYARIEKPAMICISAATAEAARDLNRLHQMLSFPKPAPRFGFGGCAFNINPALRASTPGIFLASLLLRRVRRYDNSWLNLTLWRLKSPQQKAKSAYADLKKDTECFLNTRCLF